VSPEKDPAKFWKNFGKKQNSAVEDFVGKKKAMEQAAAETVAAGDAPEVKLQARQLPVIFDGPRRDTDTFEITMPAGYEVDDLPPAVDMDYSLASYHSKTEAAGNKLKYTRTLEIKELSVPMEKMDALRKFYRVIATDERNTAVLKPSAAAASAK